MSARKIVESEAHAEAAQVAQVALDAFWESVAASTGASTGDLSPDAEAAFAEAAERAVAAWMSANVPRP